MTFIRERRNWVEYRQLPGVYEVDFHYCDFGPREVPYGEAMANVKEMTLKALKEARADPLIQYVLFRHGSSTSGPFRETARSVVRRVMRSKESTPLKTLLNE